MAPSALEPRASPPPTHTQLYVLGLSSSMCIASGGEAVALSDDHKPDDAPEKERILANPNPNQP